MHPGNNKAQKKEEEKESQHARALWISLGCGCWGEGEEDAKCAKGGWGRFFLKKAYFAAVLTLGRSVFYAAALCAECRPADFLWSTWGKTKVYFDAVVHDTMDWFVGWVVGLLDFIGQKYEAGQVWKYILHMGPGDVIPTRAAVGGQ